MRVNKTPLTEIANNLQAPEIPFTVDHLGHSYRVALRKRNGATTINVSTFLPGKKRRERVLCEPEVALDVNHLVQTIKNFSGELGRETLVPMEEYQKALEKIAALEQELLALKSK